MADDKFLTTEEVSERYRDEITVGTLRNWCAMRIDPAVAKIGKAVIYPMRVRGLESREFGDVQCVVVTAQGRA